MKTRDQLKKERAIIAVLFAAVMASFIISLGLGRYSVSVKDIILILKDFIFKTNSFTGDKKSIIVVTQVRLPRLLLCSLIGSALAASGASFQGLFRNPMVSPDVLGVSTGAAVGACIAILCDFSSIMTQLMAFSFGILAVLLVTGLSTAIGRGNPQTVLMVLAGMVISSLFNAVNTLLRYLAIDNESKLADITYWLMGSFSKNVNYRNVMTMFIVFLIGGGTLLLIRWKINVLAFGEEEAQAMGINTKRIQFAIIISATMLTATSVSLVGNIGWVGLTLPHITRLMVGPNYKTLLPVTMLSGSLFMMWVDNMCRCLTSTEVPIGVFTSIIGAPVFIYLMFNGKKGWS